MKKLGFLLSLGLFTLFIQSCQQDPIEEPQTDVAPQLPPAQSFIMPFTGFENADTSGLVSDEEIESRSPSTFRNWFYSATNLVVWNTLVGVTSAVPVIAFGEAFNHRPTRVGDGIFLWSYDYNIGDRTYTANLTGQFINGGEDTKWEMRISQSGGFSEVLWYSGIVSVDENKATWTLNYQPENPTPFLRIEYQNNESTSEFFIRYTNIIPGDEGNGDYIEYRIQPDTEFNRAYDVFLENEGFLEIQWDEPSSAGRVRNPEHFGDNDWHCWDAELRDTDC